MRGLSNAQKRSVRVHFMFTYRAIPYRTRLSVRGNSDSGSCTGIDLSLNVTRLVNAQGKVEQY